MKTEIEAEKRFPTQLGMVDTEQEYRCASVKRIRIKSGGVTVALLNACNITYCELCYYENINPEEERIQRTKIHFVDSLAYSLFGNRIDEINYFLGSTKNVLTIEDTIKSE